MPKWLPSLFLLLQACHSIQPYLEAAAEIEPKTYVIIAPPGRDELDCVRDFVARKRRSGFDVQFVTFAPAVPVPERFAAVASGLQARTPVEGKFGYVLVLATDVELPMANWRIPGSKAGFQSDLPLLMGHTDPSKPLTETEWLNIVGSELPWIAGRLPFNEEPRIRRALAASWAYASRDTPPLAMLGAERYSVWWDSSIVMARARRPMEARGWRTVTYGQDWPCDVELDIDPEDVPAAYATAGLKQRFKTPADLIFLAHWCELAPDVVYLNSHGSSFGLVSVGDYLLSDRDIKRVLRARGEGDRGPRHPALVVIGACQAGGPTSDLTESLFRHGFASAVIASTENTSPTPLRAAIWAEIDTGAALASGLSVGLAFRAVRLSYLDDARSSWSYALFDSTAVGVAKNLLGLTLYGDPAMPMRLARQPRMP